MWKPEESVWSSNQQTNQAKVQRAIKQLKTEGKEITEEAVKALYVKFGGLVVDEVPEEIVETPAPRRRR